MKELESITWTAVAVVALLGAALVCASVVYFSKHRQEETDPLGVPLRQRFYFLALNGAMLLLGALAIALTKLTAH